MKETTKAVTGEGNAPRVMASEWSMRIRFKGKARHFDHCLVTRISFDDTKRVMYFYDVHDNKRWTVKLKEVEAILPQMYMD